MAWEKDNSLFVINKTWCPVLKESKNACAAEIIGTCQLVIYSFPFIEKVAARAAKLPVLQY